MKYVFNPFLGNLDAIQDVSGYVPYTGATTHVNLGTYNLSANDLSASGYLYIDNAQFYTSSDNLYIRNPTSNKDIYFRVSDGGATTDLLFLDASASRVGILTTSPSYPLDVTGSIRTTDTLYASSRVLVNEWADYNLGSIVLWSGDKEGITSTLVNDESKEAPAFNFYRARNTGIYYGDIVEGDYLGQLRGFGFITRDTGWAEMVNIKYKVDGKIIERTSYPSRIEFWTTSAGKTEPALRLTLNNRGDLYPEEHTAQSLGLDSNAWKALFVHEAICLGSASFIDSDVSNWNTAYGWGNHASRGYARLNYDNDGYVRADQIIASGSGSHPSITNGYVELYMYNNGGNYVGRILPYDGSSYKDLAIGDWNGGNANIYLKVGGNVGINNGNPTEKLHVSGNILATGTVLGSNLSGTNTGDQDLSGYVPYTGATDDVDLGDHTLTCGGSTSGQSIISSGLVVNEDGGGTANDDFRAETDTVSNALFVDASADEVQINAVFKLPNIKSGATQVAAGAAANELWKTASHATLPDNVVMIGV